VQALNPIGAGDAFAAGLVAALEGGATLSQAAVEGTAAAAASVETALPGQVDAARARSLVAEVAVQPVEAGPDPKGSDSLRGEGE
jgi:sugar/nucleoside kinase (ribokinase family)